MSDLPEFNFTRPVNANADEQIGKVYPVQNGGFVVLVDVMGNDSSIVQAARVSYGAGTKSVRDDHGLINYLMKMKHSSPFEQCDMKFLMRLPIFVARQLVRHRTACLAGDTPLVFNRPCDGKPYRLTIKEVFDRFQPTSWPTAAFGELRDRVQTMQLRCVNEETGELATTNVVDVWESGVKPVYKVSVQTPHAKREIKASKDHLFFTPDGWKKLEELEPGSMVTTISSRTGVEQPSFNQIDEELEEWAPIPDWEEYYEISSQGRVRRIVGGRGSRSHGRCKKITVSNERAVTSLNRPGEQTVIHICRTMLRAFVGEPEDGAQACHINGNSLDDRLENLRWGTSKDNSEDMVDHGRSTFLCAQPCEIISIVPSGEEMTYDIEVAGPRHNFSANDFVVHNSLNEYSMRYSEAIEGYWEPEEWRAQDKRTGGNKQGSGGTVDYTPHQFPSKAEDIAVAEYNLRLEDGVAREQARSVLPLSSWTEWYWKIDLHNLMHFLRLRLNPHAQKEIRDYAEAIMTIFKACFPLTSHAFEKHVLHALTFSEDELAQFFYDVDWKKLNLKKRRRDEILAWGERHLKKKK